jgi:geranylgeranylglycerol-phosphate geranylgeranyltransferase
MINMKNKKLIGFYRLFRFDLSFAAGTCALLGELLAVGGIPSLHNAVFGFISVFFISAASLIINDLFDIEMDRINSPDRPLPSGMVTKFDVIIFFILCSILGFFSSMMIGVGAFVFVVLIWMVGFLYNWKLKRYGLMGNLFVAFSVGMTFIFGGLAVGKPFEILVWFMGITAFLIDLGEEIAADSIDVEGDREGGSRSLAVLLGPEKAMKISAGVFSLMIIWSFVPFVFGWMEWPYLLPLAVLDLIIVFSTIKLLDPGTTKRLNYIRFIYLGGLVAIIIMIILRLLFE